MGLIQKISGASYNSQEFEVHKVHVIIPSSNNLRSPPRMADSRGLAFAEQK